MSEDRVKIGTDSNMCGASLQGKRPKDEDFVAGFQMDTKLGWSCRVAVICDGMGGGERGEDASETAAKVLLNNIRTALGPKPKKGGLLSRIQSRTDLSAPRPEMFASTESRKQFWNYIIAECHEKVRALAEGSKVGTTLTALVFAQEKSGNIPWCDLIHMGDTRCYRLGAKPADCEIISQDHSLTGDMVQGGYIEVHEIPETHGHNVITRSVGMDEKPTADVTTIQISKGERFLLCCDGVWGPLHTEQGLWMPDAKLSDQDQVDAWTDKALSEGSTDNCSALLLEV